jgi:hypothetical protein
LGTYITVKNNFGFEKYLGKIKNFEQRRTLTRFRISAHKLAIENGRYKEFPDTTEFAHDARIIL